MNRIIAVCVCLTIACTFAAIAQDKPHESVAKIVADANQQRSAAMAKAYQEYWKSVSEAFRFADEVEVLLLDPTADEKTVEAAKEQGHVHYSVGSKKDTLVVKQVSIDKSKIPQWTTAVANMLTRGLQSEKAEGHIPMYAIEIHAGGETLLEATIGEKFGNYYFHNGNDAVYGFGTMTKDDNQLRELFNALRDSLKQDSGRENSDRTKSPASQLAPAK